VDALFGELKQRLRGAATTGALGMRGLFECRDPDSNHSEPPGEKDGAD
jgi:hypothetical protein